MTKLKQTVNFVDKNIYVGIDVHLKSWDVSICFDQRYLRSFQQPPEASKLISTLQRDYPNASFHCAYEAGFSGYSLQRQLQEAGMNCMVVNAADVPQTDKDRKTKTDRGDSKRIALALQGGLLRPIYIPDKRAQGNRRLVRYRQQLLRDLQRSKVRVKHFLHQQSIAIPPPYDRNNWSNNFVAWLKELPHENEIDKHTFGKMVEQIETQRKEVNQLTKKIHELLTDKQYKELAPLLLSIPGIGPLTAATLLVELVDIKRFPSFVQLNSFIGFCPGEHSSGEDERRGHIISRHHKTLRSLLIEAAWVAIKHDPALTLAYSELKKTMTGKQAITRIARKLLNRIYHVWLKKEEYEKGTVK
jgi:transposase